ncbi:hypothetical protein JCM17960_09260 [Magnetospira thiophila]
MGDFFTAYNVNRSKNPLWKRVKVIVDMRRGLTEGDTYGGSESDDDVLYQVAASWVAFASVLNGAIHVLN